MPDDQNPSTSTPVESTASLDPATPAPSASEPTQPITPVAARPASKKKRNIIIAAVIAAVLLVLGGGSALAYNLWYQNPDKVVSDAIVNAVSAKTVSLTGKMDIESDEYKIKIEASGRSTTNPDVTMAVKLDYSSEGVNFSVDGEGIFSANGDMYVKLNDAKQLVTSIEEQSGGEVSFEVFDGVINKIDGNWIKISKSDLGEVSEDFEKTQKCTDDLLKRYEDDADFRKKVENETATLYKENKFIVVDKKLGSRTINGEGSLGYQLRGDSAAADKFFTGFGETEFGKSIKECNKDIDFSDLIDGDTKEEPGVTTEVQLWVSRFGHQITEITVKGSDDESKGSIVLNPVFNKDEAVTIPTDFVEFTELKADIEKAYEDYYESYFGASYEEVDYMTTESSSTLFN